VVLGLTAYGGQRLTGQHNLASQPAPSGQMEIRRSAISEKVLHQASVFFLRLPVRIMGELLQPAAVPDGDDATGRLDKSISLENVKSCRDARPTHGQHYRNVLVRKGQFISGHAVVAHQYPAGQAFIHFMERVGCGGVCQLHSKSFHGPCDHRGKAFASLHPSLKRTVGDSVAISRHLYVDVVGIDMDATERRGGHISVETEYSGLGMIFLLAWWLRRSLFRIP
jgi:hypothetical protein